MNTPCAHEKWIWVHEVETNADRRICTECLANIDISDLWMAEKLMRELVNAWDQQYRDIKVTGSVRLSVEKMRSFLNAENGRMFD